MTSNFSKVREFHVTFQHPIETTCDKEIFTKNPKLVSLRVALINEEKTELTAAINAHDLIEVVDALADLLYVTYGAGQALGINLDNTFDILHKSKVAHREKSMSNFSKVHSTNDFNTITDKDIFARPRFVKFYVSQIENEFDNLKVAVENQDMNKVSDALTGLLYAVYEAGHAFRVDLDKAFDIVHKSNMTKACNTEQEAIDTVADILKKGVYKDPQYKKDPSDKFWIVYDASTGKILKSKYYTPADLKYVNNV